MIKGSIVALITPFDEEGRVNYSRLRELIDFHIEKGTDGILVLGTTGETPALTEEEQEEIVRVSIEQSSGRVPIIANSGTNNTEKSLDRSLRFERLGADGLLVITPYYNKPNRAGMIEHFYRIADNVSVPVYIYNVPSRTGVNIEPETYARLAEHPMITGIKEANGNIAKIVETKALVGDKLDIWSGNDDQIVPILAAGGSGVISVLSNVLPKKTVELCNKFFAGDVKGSMDMQCEMFDLIKALFCEVNPIPAKAAVAALGYCENYVRLPLTPMEKQHEEVLLECMRKQGLKV